MRRDDLPAVLDDRARASFAQPWSRSFFEKELATPFARLRGRGRRERRRAALIVGYTCRWRVRRRGAPAERRRASRARGGRPSAASWSSAVLDEARAAGARVVFLEVRAGNVVARRLYRRLGFRDLGRPARLLRARPGRHRDGAPHRRRAVSAAAARRHPRRDRRRRAAEPGHRGVGHVRLRHRVRRAGRPRRRIGAISVKGLSLAPYAGQAGAAPGRDAGGHAERDRPPEHRRRRLPARTAAGAARRPAHAWWRTSGATAPRSSPTCAARLDGAPGIVALELNASSPNRPEWGGILATDPVALAASCAPCARACGSPLWVKLSPNVAT